MHNRKIPDSVIVLISVLIILTLLCGFASVIGVVLAISYLRKKQARIAVIRIVLNLSYIILDIFIVKFITKTVFSAIMGI